MNPPKYPFLCLVLLLCFSFSFANNVLDNGNQFHEGNEKEKRDRFGNFINPAKFGQFHEDNEMGTFGNKINPSKFGQFHDDDEKEKQSRFGDMTNPAKFGQLHEDDEKETQDRFGNKFNPTRGGAGTGLEFPKSNGIEKQDESGNRINPTGAGGGMRWLNPIPPYERPYPTNPWTPQEPPFDPYDGPGMGCPCTPGCYSQYDMKLWQLRKAKRFELRNRESGGDFAGSGGRDDESFGSMGRIFP